MNQMLLGIMQREVGHQATNGLIAGRHIEQALGMSNPDVVELNGPEDLERPGFLEAFKASRDQASESMRAAGTLFWYSIPVLLTSVANISKLLWGQSGSRSEQRRELRESLGIPDDSPLAETKMRNNFEHIDERLEKWDATSPTHNYIDHIIAPAGSIVIGDPYVETNTFRSYDPSTGLLTFWGDSFHVIEMIKALEEVAHRAAGFD